MTHNINSPIIPEQLIGLADDSFYEVHERWSSVSLEEVLSTMPEPSVVDLGDRRARAVLLPGSGGYRDESTALLLGLPHQQAWKPSMYIRSAVAQEVIRPESPMIVLPSNSFRDEYQTYTAEELARMNKGDLAPHFELSTRIVESFGIKGRIAVSGYSKGGLTALGVGATESDEFEVVAINADETPSTDYTSSDEGAKILQKNFLSSGGWGEQRQAIREAGIPALMEALNARRLALDYLRFGISSISAANRAINRGMTKPNIVHLIERAKTITPSVEVKIGHVAGSNLVDAGTLDDLSGDAVRIVGYDGLGVHRHPTADNPYLHALMMKDGISSAL